MHFSRTPIPLAAVLLIGCLFTHPAAAKPTFVMDGMAFRIGEGQPGGQSSPSLTFWDTHTGFVATWLNDRGSSNKLAFSAFFLSGSSPIATAQLDGNGGPTKGKSASSAAPVVYSDGTSLALFAVDRTGASASAKRDIFGQPMANGPFAPSGAAIGINQNRPGAQDSILAARLSNGNALIVFRSSPSGGEIHGRVLSSGGAAVTDERKLTAETSGAQQPLALAALQNGRAVLSYVVKNGKTWKFYVQRLDGSGKRLGKPALIKSTSGDASFGGVGVSRLPNGSYAALWFEKGNGGSGTLKGRTFSVSGAAGDTKTVATRRTVSKTLAAPRLALTEEGALVAATAGDGKVEGWLLSTKLKRQAGPVPLGAGDNSLLPESLVWLGEANFIVSWTLSNPDPKKTRAFAQRFHIFDCARCH